MKYKIVSNFKGVINGVNFDNEQDYNYLKEFIENLEDRFKLEINNKEATEFLRNELYEETEYLYEVQIDEYYEAHCRAMDNLYDSILIIKGLLGYLKEKIVIK